MQHFTEKVIAIIRRIPCGKVTTYGLIAAAAGNHCGARQVARILHSSSDKYKLPWHRVVNVKGEISARKSMGHVAQRDLLEKEAIFLDSGRISLKRFLWIPDQHILQDRTPAAELHGIKQVRLKRKKLNRK